MKLSQLDTLSAARHGATMEVRDKNGAVVLKDDGTPVTITLLGKHSDEWVNADNATRNRRMSAGLRMKLTAEGLESDAISALARVTIAWDGIDDDDGVPMVCNYQNAVKVYTTARGLREQVDEFIGNTANF